MKMRVLRFVIIAIVIVQSFGAPRVASGATTWVPALHLRVNISRHLPYTMASFMQVAGSAIKRMRIYMSTMDLTGQILILPQPLGYR